MSMELPDGMRVREVTSGFRTRKIPADVIYLDIDYQDRNRPFTVNRQSFPTFEQMIKDLGQTGVESGLPSPTSISRRYPVTSLTMTA